MTLQPQTTRLYRLVAVSFGAGAVLLLAVLVTIAFSTSLVTVTLEPKEVATSFSATVAQTGEGDRHLRGRYFSLTQSGKKVVTGTTNRESAAKARGLVTIVNRSSRNQPLMATTRLLSSGGELFRTTKRVDVPAGGSIEVEVEADQPGASGEIGPSTFALPGLRPENQKLITGTSSAPMTGGTISTTEITAADRAATQTALQRELTASVLEQLEREATANGLPASLTILREEATPTAAKIANMVNVHVTIEALAYEPTALTTIAREELQRSVGPEETVMDVQPPDVNLTLSSGNAADGTAIVAVKVVGTATLDPGNPLLQPARFTGKTKAEIAGLIASIPGIKSAAVSLSPFWAQRTPRQPDRIRILINRASLTPPTGTSRVEESPETTAP